MREDTTVQKKNSRVCPAEKSASYIQLSSDQGTHVRKVLGGGKESPDRTRGATCRTHGASGLFTLFKAENLLTHGALGRVLRGFCLIREKVVLE